MMKLSLVEWLRKGQEQFSFRMEESLIVNTADGKQLVAIAHLHDFGSTNGMLIFGDYGLIRDTVDSLLNLGYGFSVMEACGSNYVYDQEDFVEVLRDWGWSSNDQMKPDWL